VGSRGGRGGWARLRRVLGPVAALNAAAAVPPTHRTLNPRPHLFHPQPPPTPTPPPHPPVAKKNFTLGGAGGNSPPVIPAGLTVTGRSGGQALIPAITDPDGDTVSLDWTIDPDGLAIPGMGSVVSLRGVPPGDYSLAIVARDDRGASSTGRATLRVTAGGASAGGGEAPPPAGGAGEGLSLRLPSLTLSAGASVILDAGATGIPPEDRNDFTYAWSLSQKSSGNRVDSAATPVARFNLSRADTYQLQLAATSKRSGTVSSATSNVRVLAKADPQLPRITPDSKCGPFTSTAGQETRLACPGIQVVTAGGAPYTNITFAWRVTNIASGAVKTGIGKEFNAGR
jgi:hypothetical protein